MIGFQNVRIDEAMIDRLVRGFYAKVQGDALLGPVFAAKVKDWEPHLQQMCAFWSSVMLMSGRYRGNPMIKHMPLPIDAHHFGRWLDLFEETANELCPPDAAAAFVDRAHRIAESLMMNLERFRRVAGAEPTPTL